MFRVRRLPLFLFKTPPTRHFYKSMRKVRTSEILRLFLLKHDDTEKMCAQHTIRPYSSNHVQSPFLEVILRQSPHVCRATRTIQAGFKSDVHDVGVVQIIQRHDQLASHISLHR